MKKRAELPASDPLSLAPQPQPDEKALSLGFAAEIYPRWGGRPGYLPGHTRGGGSGYVSGHPGAGIVSFPVVYREVARPTTPRRWWWWIYFRSGFECYKAAMPITPKPVEPAEMETAPNDEEPIVDEHVRDRD